MTAADAAATRGRRAAPAKTTSERLAALETATRCLDIGPVGAADGRPLVPPDETALVRARTVLRRAVERRHLSAAHTVVALAGATGGGKSSLFNALAGEDRVAVGARRPTTAEPVAGMAGDPEGAAPLLDWLEIGQRHLLGVEGLDGMILVDLPDVDSVVLAHQRTVDRLAQAVDVLIWVLDPQKYADNLVHQRYLRPMATHAEVTIVLLNQTDTLAPSERAGVLADLRHLLAEDGLADVPVILTSATTGEGVADLRAAVAAIVTARTAMEARLAADARAAARDLLQRAGSPDPAGVTESDRRRLAVVLAEAAGVEVVAEAVARSHRMRSRAATGWPVTRWLGRTRADPLRRLGLDRVFTEPTGGPTLARSSLPRPTPVQRAQVLGAVRALGHAASGGSVDPWRTAIRATATDAAADLGDALDQAIVSTRLDSVRAPRWWRVVGVLQWLILAAAVTGLVWLAGIAAADYLRLPPVEPPRWGALPWPSALLAGGVLCGLLLSLLSALAARGGGRRRSRKVRARLRESVARVADEVVVAPVTAQVERCVAMNRAAQRALT